MTRGCRRLLIALLATACMPLTVAPGAGQVDGSKHDFSGRDAVGRRSAVCTFCHTPHRGYETRLAWNHTLSANVYRWTKLVTGGGTPYATISRTWQGPSRFCLSCHDGSVAIGDVSWFNGRSWTGSPIDSRTHNGDNVQIGTVTGDLTNNHPLSFPYPFAGIPSTYNGVTTGASALASGWRADPTTVGIRLFRQTGTNVSAGTAIGSTGIECSSCHDPHNDAGNVEDTFFLRGSREARDPNYICRKCHLAMGDYQQDESLHPHRPRFR